MKRKLLLTAVFFVLAFTLLAFGAFAAECEEHDNDLTVEIGTQGFLGEVSVNHICKVCGAKTTEIIPKLFITRGYSYTEDGGITQAYGINRPAIERYEEITSESVKFGAVIAIREALGYAKYPLDANAEPVTNGVKTMDYTDTDFSIINVSVKGIPEESYDSATLICAFYINVGGRNTYIDNGAEKEECYGKTFTQVSEITEMDKTNLPTKVIIDGEKYHELTVEELGFVENKFWNGSGTNSGSGDSNNRFWATAKFTEETLPVGSIIYVDGANDYQYRPNKFTGNRPGNTKQSIVVVDEAWWDGYYAVGFNIGRYTKEPGVALSSNGAIKTMDDISDHSVEDIAKIFKIYVPIEKYIGSEDGVSEKVTENGYEKQEWNEDGALKVLCIGNSFSEDTVQYLYQVADAMGVERISVGNLSIGSCSLATHLSNAKSNKEAYTYYVNRNGTMANFGKKSIEYAVKNGDWDYIVFQQVSGQSGVSSSYSTLEELISIVEPLNPSAKLVWNMTWAYQGNSGHSDFAKYDNDQITMYNAIVNAVQENIVENDKISLVIPTGTAVQNARTSYIGDALTRDGYHLTEDFGRYTAALTIAKALTGLSIDNVTYAPSNVNEKDRITAIESANNAVSSPYEVTNSQYIITIPDDYIQLNAEQLGLIYSAYYQSSADMYAKQFVNDANDEWANGFATTKRFTKETLPVGSIIIIEDGWQYRPEGWVWAGSRPGVVTTNKILIDEKWWGSYYERAFNISKVTHTDSSHDVITEEEAANLSNIFKVYVPKSALEVETKMIDSSLCDETVVTINGKQYRALSSETLDMIREAYYNSTSKAAQGDLYTGDGTAKKFFATAVLDKDILVDGSLIWVSSTYKYRPEGWQSLEKKNSASRPGEVNTTLVAVTSEWWGNFNYRAFNISKRNSKELTDAETVKTANENFKIYIPIENIKGAGQ